MTENELLDLKLFFKEGGDPGFSPERNRAVIEGTIRKYNQRRREAEKLHARALDERVDAAADYIKHLETSRGETDPERYFGKKYLTQLQAHKIVDKLQMLTAQNEKVRKLDWKE